MPDHQTHILMTGGGTMGPVTPLLGIVEAWRQADPDVRMSWIGTPDGPERDVIERSNIQFTSLWVPKLSRHQWLTWPLVPFLLLVSCVKATIALRQLKPDIIFTAGGYVSVPIVWVAKFLKIPCWVHQLDVVPGIANKLMAPLAKRISVTWKESAKDFSSKKTSVVGGLVRSEIYSGHSETIINRYQLSHAKPTVLIFGGGTGAESINQAVEVIAQELAQVLNIILITGKGKMTSTLRAIEHPGFLVKEFLNEEMIDVLTAADVVVARAGMATIIELVSLKKPTILIPIRHSHQEKNAKALEDRGAAEVIWDLTPQVLKQGIERLALDHQKRRGLAQRIQHVFKVNAAEIIVEEAIKLIQK